MNGTEEIVVRLAHDQALFEESSSMNRGKNSLRHAFLFAGAIVALVFLGLSAANVKMSGDVKLTFAGVWMAFGALFLYSEWIREMAARRRFLRSPDRDKTVEYRLSASGVKIRAAAANPEWEWNAFVKALLCDSGILLYLSRTLYLPLLKRGFKRNGDFVAACDLVRSFVPKCVDRRKPVAADSALVEQ